MQGPGKSWVEQLHTSGTQRFRPVPGPCAPPPRSQALRRRQTLAVPSSEPLASRSRVAGEKARSNTRALWPAPAAASERKRRNRKKEVRRAGRPGRTRARCGLPQQPQPVVAPEDVLDAHGGSVTEVPDNPAIPQTDTQAAACCWLGLDVLYKVIIHKSSPTPLTRGRAVENCRARQQAYRASYHKPQHLSGTVCAEAAGATQCAGSLCSAAPPLVDCQSAQARRCIPSASAAAADAAGAGLRRGQLLWRGGRPAKQRGCRTPRSPAWRQNRCERRTAVHHIRDCV